MSEQKVDPIVTDQKALRKISKPTTWEEVKKLNIIERIKASNETAWTPGVGLAAVQIGLLLRVAWFKDDGKEYILLNPVIKEVKTSIVCPKEGCLSIPDTWSQVKRHYEVTIYNQVVKEEEKVETETQYFSGFTAMVVQHEIDHMNGVLNIDKRYVPVKVAGRNEPCPCGSGVKYKKCCIDKLEQPEVKTAESKTP
jgi:peptide deformylase